MDSEQTRKPLKVHLVSSNEFTHLTRTLTRSSLVAIDAEWKPKTSSDDLKPAVCLLQLACAYSTDSVVFLLDLLSIPLDSISKTLRDLLVSPHILKLGFRFKQDLVYLSSTFTSHGCDDGFFDRVRELSLKYNIITMNLNLKLGFVQVEPYMDITSIYNYVQYNQYEKRMSKNVKSLATICKEVLGISLSKELQCSDWSHRPLTEPQLRYAAMDAHCLLDIFDVFQAKVIKEWDLIHNVVEPNSPISDIALREAFELDDLCDKTLRMDLCKASDMKTCSSDISPRIASEQGTVMGSHQRCPFQMDESLLKVVRKFGEKLLLKDSDKKPKISKKKGKRRSSSAGLLHKENELEILDWQGPLPWDSSNGGNGCPMFLCDVMVEGLAKHLRCVGIDAAIPYSKKPDPRELINQAHRENRVLLTRDSKLLSYQYAIKNKIYRVKNLLKNEQLLEVIEAFQLQISEGQLMSRCTKCNGRFIQKPLTTEEAVEAAKGFQRIPNCLFNKNLEFWQCMDCHQLYWEGTQYKNAIQKFIDVCKLND